MQVNSNPLISVIIPTYNREKLISETLNSLINQTYKKWEAIIVDDCSDDATKHTVLNYSIKDKRIKFFERNREPKGGAVCRNIGLKNAGGEYIVFLDSDDLLAPWCLKERIKNMLLMPKLDFGVFHAKTFTQNIDDGRLHTKNMNARNPLYHFIAGHTIWQTTCPIWKKNFIEKINGFDERFQRFQDTEFSLRALLAENVQFKIFADLKPDCYYRVSHENRSKEFYDKVAENNFMFLENVLNINPKKINVEIFKQALYILNLFGVSYVVRSSGKYINRYKNVLQQLKTGRLLSGFHYRFLILMLNLLKHKFTQTIAIKNVYNILLLRIAFLKINFL